MLLGLLCFLELRILLPVSLVLTLQAYTVVQAKPAPLIGRRFPVLVPESLGYSPWVNFTFLHKLGWQLGAQIYPIQFDASSLQGKRTWLAPR